VQKLLRFADLKNLGIINNWPDLKRKILTQGFPAGFYLGQQTRCWEETSVQEWIASRPNAMEKPAPLRGRAKRLVESVRAREAASESAEA
jgi:hypothetical protein